MVGRVFFVQKRFQSRKERNLVSHVEKKVEGSPE